MYLPTAARAATDTGADSTEPNAALFLECVSCLPTAPAAQSDERKFRYFLVSTAALGKPLLVFICVPGRKAQ